jgi:AAA+ superfamily predicted ATPase
MEHSSEHVEVINSLFANDSELQRTFETIETLSGLTTYVKAIVRLLINGTLSSDTLNEILATHQLDGIEAIKNELCDLTLYYLTLVLKKGSITDKEVQRIKLLQYLFKLKEGDLYKYKLKEVKELLKETLEAMYADNVISPDESLYLVHLQDIFRLSYDNFDDIKELEVCKALKRGACITNLDTANRHLITARGELNQTYINSVIDVSVLIDTEIGQKQEHLVHQLELNALIGLTSVKQEVATLVNFLQIQRNRKAQGLKSAHPSYHCVFTGNPGTGKTTVARIIAGIYKSLGILCKGHLVETDRSGLVAEYVGQTAVKTNNIIDSALDGVLFIDEAYSLISNGESDYGKEAIATLLKRMEDNRDRLVVILAGYSVEMQQFIDSNPGLQSRFNRYIAFPDYSAEELLLIFKTTAIQCDYVISDDAEAILKDYLTAAVAIKDKNFGNARFVRNLFEKTIEKQANRLSEDPDLIKEELLEIQAIDVPVTPV